MNQQYGIYFSAVTSIITIDLKHFTDNINPDDTVKNIPDKDFEKF